jgi:tRNA (guanine-N7-)-methyltransferase
MERPDNRSYKLRGARATPAQEAAYAALWQKYGLNPDGVLDLNRYFPTSKRIIMEIGTGMGEATAQIVHDDPETGFLAIEVHKPGIGALMNLANKNGSTNLRIIEEDAHMVLKYWIKDSALDAVHLYFPDPWPKRKHQKRRIVQEPFLQLIAPKIKKGGYIHIATDWIEYADWIADVFARSTLFSGAVIPRPDFRPISKFEGQGIRKGHQVTDFRFFKG